MAEVGRVAVSGPGSRLLPGGFWAAVAVWVERPQVANKRLCGVRLEARRSVSLPQTGHTHLQPPQPCALQVQAGPRATMTWSLSRLESRTHPAHTLGLPTLPWTETGENRQVLSIK